MSDHFDGERFFNPWYATDKNFSDFLKWRRTAKRDPWPNWIENSHKPKLNLPKNDSEWSFTFVNHATMLVESSKLNFITDPVFSTHTSPFQFMGPKRVRPAGVQVSELPQVHVVLVSHNHYDHIDTGSIRVLSKKYDPIFVTPLKNADVLKSAGAKKIIELDWWQSTSIEDTEIICVPAQHWSGRGFRDRRKCLWGGLYVKDKKKSFYFAGDTGYAPFFKEIKEKIGAPDISLLPIGAYEPRWFMESSHMNPEDAVLAHKDLSTKKSIGIHFGTWRLTDEKYEEPILHLEQAKQKHSLDSASFVALENGQTDLVDVRSL